MLSTLVLGILAVIVLVESLFLTWILLLEYTTRWKHLMYQRNTLREVTFSTHGSMHVANIRADLQLECAW